VSCRRSAVDVRGTIAGDKPEELALTVLIHPPEDIDVRTATSSLTGRVELKGFDQPVHAQCIEPGKFGEG